MPGEPTSQGLENGAAISELAANTTPSQGIHPSPQNSNLGLIDSLTHQLGPHHGHLYATSSSGEKVSLPTRPEAEVPEEWAGIKPAQPEEVVRLRSILQSRLTPYLRENAEGSL